MLDHAFTIVLAAGVSLTIASTGATAGTGVTKIAPRAAEAGHPFTLIDSGLGRLVDGSVAVFRLDGRIVTISLDAHRPYNAAHGRLPSNLGGGTYAVSVRRPDATEFEVGEFVVLGPPTITGPSISPSSGVVGTTFTITDPGGRMFWADRVVFAPEGQAPEAGAAAGSVVFSSDGTTATGTVPTLAEVGPNNVTVHAGDPTTNPPLFGAVGFNVT